MPDKARVSLNDKCQVRSLKTLRLMLGIGDEIRLAIAGGPGEYEPVSAWRKRRQKKSVEQKRAERERSEPSRAHDHPRSEQEGGDPAPAGHISFSGAADADQVLREQLASFGELRELCRESHQSLEEVKQLLGKHSAGEPSPGDELTNETKLRELDRLLAMAKSLEEMAVRATLAVSLGMQQ